MDALDVARVCVRRWYVFLTMVGLATFAGLGLMPEGHPVYNATGNFAVVYQGPAVKPGQADPRAANPLAASNGLLLRQSIVNDLNSPKSQAELAPADLMGTAPSDTPDGSRFSVVTQRNSENVTVQTYGPDPARVSGTVTAILKAAENRAMALQDRARAPKNSRLSVFVTLPAQTVEIPPASKLKLVLSLAAVGILAGAGLSLLLDRLLTKRRARRLSRPVQPLAAPVVHENESATPTAMPAAGGNGSQPLSAPRTAAADRQQSVPLGGAASLNAE
ncbi:hypothetical protein N864_02170 [Intrasporangium chromatireducens Q5-1]|uniref:Lipopolysaccharide biosynthesis protein n=1 Tax=Intrasporangium chromatireducens Q5-1 TaxID=584657 RepID=W9GGT6_9MICO|nr:hypothetical protein [Intrasporangium chromatireducens]EWT05295.1 hypothetical protein N864_02170 [Intrasporangium chromatireducens Q5-1]